MPTKHFILAAGIAAIVVVLVVAITSLAAGTTYREASLTSNGMAYEVNTDAAGNLFISDYDAKEIWQLQPSTSAFTKYQNLPSPSDASPDSSGNIWFTDWRSTTGRINVLPQTLTTWTIEPGPLGGLDFDDTGRLWIATRPSTPTGAAVYRFDPQSSQLCGFEWLGGSNSEYVLFHAGSVWLADRHAPRIIRFDPEAAQDQVRWWSLPPGSRPRGLALDTAGHLWWADLGADALAFLDPDSNQVTTYALSPGSLPEMLILVGGRVWYTTISGNVGALNPALAGGTAATATTGTLTVTSTACRSLGTGATTSVSSAQGTLAWGTSSELTPLVDADGWTIYELPYGADLYGIAQSAGSLWVADSGRRKLIRLEVPPPAPPKAPVDLEVAVSGADLLLTWQPVTEDLDGNPITVRGYRVYRSSTDPYFEPGAGSQIAEPGAPSYTDSRAASGTSSYYYTVQAVGPDGQLSGASNRFGRFVRTLLPQWNLVAWPLLVSDAKLDVVLGQQLHGTESPDTADRVLVWDGASRSYSIAWYCGGPTCESWGQPWANHWLSEDYASSTLILSPDAGFWIENRSGSSEVLRIVGIVAEADRSVPIDSGWQLLGSAIPLARPMDDAGLPAVGTDSPETADRVFYWDAAAQSYKSAWYCGGTICEGWGQPWANHWLADNYASTDIVLQPGHGFWFENRHGPVLWVNRR